MTLEEKNLAEFQNEDASSETSHEQQFEESELEPKLNWQTVLAFLVRRSTFQK
jgi:hypothetical protein